MIYGYCRVSTPKQKIERQRENITKVHPDAVIIEERYTGTTLDRPAWGKLRRILKAGDLVVFDEVSRMSRSAAEGFALYEELFHEGVELEFLKEPHLNTRTYKEAAADRIQMTGTEVDIILEAVNRYLLELARRQIALAFSGAEREVERLHQRTREGIARARMDGKQIGRAAGCPAKSLREAPVKALIRKYSRSFDGSLDDADVLRLLGSMTVKVGAENRTAKVSRRTYYKYKGEIKSET